MKEMSAFETVAAIQEAVKPLGIEVAFFDSARLSNFSGRREMEVRFVLPKTAEEIEREEAARKQYEAMINKPMEEKV